VKGFLLLAIAAAAACTVAPPADREVRLARLAAEQRQLMDKLEDLQARLLVNRQRVRFWQEMQERHESVSAIACSSQETHAVAMAERLLPQEPKPELHARRRQVASIHAGAVRATPARR
jgi:hypothetical protein